MSIKILLVDDHQVFSSSLKMVLETNNFEVTSVTNVSRAIKYLKTSAFDIIITDIEMPEINGVEFIKELHTIKNELIKLPKIIVLTSYNHVSLFKKIHKIGINGFLSKNTSQFELTKAINKVISNENYYEAKIYNEFLSSSMDQLEINFTNRELDVLKLILNEKTTSEIAQELKISPYTVEGHRKNLLQKTNSKNVVGLIKYSLNNNLF